MSELSELIYEAITEEANKTDLERLGPRCLGRKHARKAVNDAFVLAKEAQSDE